MSQRPSHTKVVLLLFFFFAETMLVEIMRRPTGSVFCWNEILEAEGQSVTLDERSVRRCTCACAAEHKQTY